MRRHRSEACRSRPPCCRAWSNPCFHTVDRRSPHAMHCASMRSERGGPVHQANDDVRAIVCATTFDLRSALPDGQARHAMTKARVGYRLQRLPPLSQIPHERGVRRSAFGEARADMAAQVEPGGFCWTRSQPCSCGILAEGLDFLDQCVREVRHFARCREATRRNAERLSGPRNVAEHGQ